MPSIPQANNQTPATFVPQPASQVSTPSISQSTSQQHSPSAPLPNQLRLRSPSPFHQLPRGQSSPPTDQHSKQSTRPSTHLPLRTAQPLPTQQHVQTTPLPQKHLSLRRARHHQASCLCNLLQLQIKSVYNPPHQIKCYLLLCRKNSQLRHYRLTKSHAFSCRLLEYNIQQRGFGI